MHFLDRFQEETLVPLMENYIENDDYYFLNDEGEKTFNSGRVMFEAEGVPYDVAKEALRLAAQKLPLKTKFIVRNDFTN